MATPSRDRDQSLWRGTHKRRAKQLCDAGYANPDARCWLCGHPLGHPTHRYRSGRSSHWQADHVRRGDPTSPLRLAASLCNERRGGRDGAAIARRRTERPSPNA